MRRWILLSMTLALALMVSCSAFAVQKSKAHHGKQKTAAHQTHKKTTKKKHRTHTKKHKHKSATHAKAVSQVDDDDDDDNNDATTSTTTVTKEASNEDTSKITSHSANLVASMEQRVVGFVHQTVNTMRYNVYEFGGTKFDTQKGVYALDCSSYVDNILKTVYPHAFSNLVDITGADRPSTQHYYDFITRLSHNPRYLWNKIDDVSQLRPGDILVFRYKTRHNIVRGGHIMVVMNKPVQDSEGFKVRIADSAPSRHSNDTRETNESGIGIGTLLLKANPKTGRPYAYAWKEGAGWERNVKFAMARPTEDE